jgi:hypothetical protein
MPNNWVDEELCHIDKIRSQPLDWNTVILRVQVKS